MDLNLAYLAPSLFAFYLIVACNFIPEIYGCKLQTLLKSSMVAKHITGILLLFFLVIYVKPDNVDKELIYNIGLTMIIYLWFFITTRSPIIVVFLTVILLIIIYIYDIRKNRLTEEKDKNKDEINQIELYQKILSYVLIIISVVGFIYYFGQKKMEYRHKFSIYKFLTGTTSCRNTNSYPPNSIDLRKQLL
jgi:hypothetical protein